MKKPLRLSHLFFGIFALSSALLQADPIAPGSQVLLVGPAADTHEAALEGLIAGDAAANAKNITVDSFAPKDLLISYYEGGPHRRDDGLRTGNYPRSRRHHLPQTHQKFSIR